MKKDETKIQDEIIKFLKTNKVLHWRMSGASNMSGFPDLLVCYIGQFVAFEIKTPTGKPTLQQEKVIDDIKKAGGFAYIVQSVEDVEKYLEKVKEIVDGVF